MSETTVTPTVTVTPPANETFSKDYVRELREENKGWRLKASEHEQAAKDAAAAVTAAKAEADAKIAEATTAAQARIIRAEIKAAAVKAGMIDMDGLKMLDLSKLTLNDDGEVDGADALLEAAKKVKPYLFGDAKTSSTTPPPKPSDPKDKTAKDMTDDELRAFERQHKIRV